MSEPGFTREEVPLWRQALEGVGLVTVLTLVVVLAGLAVAALAALLF